MTSIPVKSINEKLTLIQYIGENSISISSLPGIENVSKIAKINSNSIITWESGVPDIFNGFTTLDRLEGYLVLSKDSSSFPYVLYSVAEIIPDITNIEKELQIVCFFCPDVLINNMNSNFINGVKKISKIENNSFITWNSGDPDFAQGFSSLNQNKTYFFLSKSNFLPINVCNIITITPTPTPTPCVCNYDTILNGPTDEKEGVSLSSGNPGRDDVSFKFNKKPGLAPPDFMTIYLNNNPICTITYPSFYNNEGFCVEILSKNYCGKFKSVRYDIFDENIPTPTPTPTPTNSPTPTPEPQIKCISTQYIDNVLNNFAESQGINISATTSCELCYFEKNPTFPSVSLQVNINGESFLLVFSSNYLGELFAINYNNSFYELTFTEGVVNV